MPAPASLYIDNRASLFAIYGGTADLVQRYTLPSTELTTDMFYFGKVTRGRHQRVVDKNVIVIISGTHGLEGGAGSYVQLQLAEKINSLRGSGIGVMLIHALNPYGYHHGRRVDAENIDVNRSGGTDFMTRCAYREVRHLVEPAVWSAASERLLREQFENLDTQRYCQAAIMGGQFDYPEGLFFGGLPPLSSRDVCWSVGVLRKIVSDFLASGMFSRGKRIAFIDIHTGLGDYGVGEIYSPALGVNDPLTAQTQEWLGRMGKEVQFPLVQDVRSSSASVSGDILTALLRFLPYDTVMPIAVEMGTNWCVADLVVALTAENWIHHHPGQLSGMEEEAIRQKISQGFFPQDDQKWLDLVRWRCLDVFSVCEDWLRQKPEPFIPEPRGNW